MICPKCHHQRTDSDDPLIPDYQCPACGIVYKKFGKPPIFQTGSAGKQEGKETFFGHEFKSKQLNTFIFTFCIMTFMVVGYFAYEDYVKQQKIKEQQALKQKAVEENIAKQQAENKLIERKKLELANQERERKRQQKEIKCQNDAHCSAEKAFTIDSQVDCQRNIEKMAKFQFKWTDGFLERKFYKFGWNDSSRTVLLATGNRIEMQNGFGAWQPMIYICKVNAANGKVIDIELLPGRL